MYRASEEIEFRPELVLEESSVRFTYVLREIAEERE